MKTGLNKKGLFHSNQFWQTVDEVFPAFIPDSNPVLTGFQMMYNHLFFYLIWKVVKKHKMFFWESGVWYNLSGSVWLRGYVNNTEKGYLLMVKCFLGKGLESEIDMDGTVFSVYFVSWH